MDGDGGGGSETVSSELEYGSGQGRMLNGCVLVVVPERMDEWMCEMADRVMMSLHACWFVLSSLFTESV